VRPNQRCAALVVGVEEHDDRVGIVGERAPAAVQHRTSMFTAGSRTRTHRRGESGGISRPLARPTPTCHLHQHTRSLLPRRPRRDRPRGADAQPHHAVVVSQRHRLTPSQQRQHRPVLEQDVGLQVLEPDVRSVADQDIEQVRPEPTAPAGRHGDRKVAVTVLADGVARLARNFIRLAVAMDHRDHPEAAT
jgi:hypothetical protein